ncbi:GAF domain-containing protein [Acuticoccus sp. MNP-M23]|uniref:GAF domain-containing protein n=1 Tax=Acuticoccus sp. MNP-M23 TaxID=3072793 RepID=UPI002815D237|nr:GAF domain-containing protein [Acuticoccus sp. MNP-M23]WMS43621.1 GAF domain-containing protein [Acuticoccus sp. MNP-M23]
MKRPEGESALPVGVALEQLDRPPPDQADPLDPRIRRPEIWGLADIGGHNLECPTSFIHTVVDDVLHPAEVFCGGKPVQAAETLARAVMTKRDVVIIRDTCRDERFKLLPEVLAFPMFRYLVGVPLISGYRMLGTLTFADYRPRPAPPNEALADIRCLADAMAFLLATRGFCV